MTAVNPLRPAPGTPRPYHFPHFTHDRLPNGLTVWTVPLPDRELVSVHLLVDGGAAAESEPEAGIAALAAETLVTGTRRLDGHAFAEATERLGIELHADSSWDVARAGFLALADRFAAGLELLAEMVREPRFDEGEFDRLREERLADILQARSEPGRLADEHFLRQCYPDGSPYGRLNAGTPETVEPLTVAQARAHHDRHWRPDHAHLVVAGPITAADARSAVEASFGDWAGTSPGHRSIPAADRGGRRVVVVDRPGSVQSELRVGHVGIARDEADYFPAIVMASLLGGTFSSRLNQRLREELGYTYGARAAFDPRRAAGPFIARAAVHTEVTADAVRETLAQLDGMQAAEPGADELREVTDFLVGVFPLRFETTGGAAAGIEPVAVYGLDHDWWATYRDRIEAVGPSEVHAAARSMLRPAEALVVLTGDADAVRPGLEAADLGPIEVIRPSDDGVAEDRAAD
jgi:predicted Zn-dependent peptidase